MSRVCWQGSPWLDRRIGVDVISLTSSWEVPHRKWVRLQEVRVLTIPAYSMLLSFSRKTYLNSFVSCPLSTCWPRTPCPIFFCRMNSMRFVAFLAFAIEKLLKWNIRREWERKRPCFPGWLRQALIGAAPCSSWLKRAFVWSFGSVAWRSRGSSC